MNGVKRSVTPEAFSAGTTAKVISGYLVRQSSAEADAVNENAAIAARTSRRLIMLHLRLLVVVITSQNAPASARCQAVAISPRAGTVESASAATGAVPMTSLASRS